MADAKKYLTAEYREKTWVICESFLDDMFLLEGEDAALLIDTGTGIGDLKGYVETLTDKPVTVVLTHGHVDHAGGVRQFDKVWVHSDDFEAVRTLTVEARRGYAANFLGSLPRNIEKPSFALEDITDYSRDLPELLPLEDGHVFDLGGRKVEVIHTPGHTPGEVVLIDHGARILFSGDAANPNLLMNFPNCPPIETALRALLRVQARESEFDANFNGHIPVIDGKTWPLPDGVLSDCIECMKGVMDGSVPLETAPGMFGRAPRTVAKYGKVMISCDPNNIYIKD